MTPLLEISEGRGDDGSLVLALAGELDMATVGLLTDRLREAAQAKDPVVLDLADLDFMDSSGLRAFLQATAEADRDGWSFVIRRPPPRLWRVIEVAGVGSFLPLTEP